MHGGHGGGGDGPAPVQEHPPALGRALKDALPTSPANLRYRAETTDYQKKYVLLRTRGHLRKIRPSTRSSGWPKMDPLVVHQEEPEEVPRHIPGGMRAGRVLHPEHCHK